MNKPKNAVITAEMEAQAAAALFSAGVTKSLAGEHGVYTPPVSAPAATQESDYRAAADAVHEAALAVRTSPDKVKALQAMFAAERELARVAYLQRSAPAATHDRYDADGYDAASDYAHSEAHALLGGAS